jgi:hypothetical protein
MNMDHQHKIPELPPMEPLTEEQAATLAKFGGRTLKLPTGLVGGEVAKVLKPDDAVQSPEPPKSE